MRKRFHILTITLISVAIVLLAAALIIFLTVSKNVSESQGATPDETAVSTAAPTVVSTEETIFYSASQAQAAIASTETEETAPETEPPVDEPAAAPVSVPDAMASVLSQAGYSADSLSALGCRQLITVSSSGSSAQIDFYSLGGDGWISDDSLSCYGYVGSNGVTSDMHEGGYASPVGLYSIGEAFYLYDRPETGLLSFEITDDTYWVDDPDSEYYNQKVVGYWDTDKYSAEHMASHPNYKYGFVINYNTDAIPGAGSAIFFHVASGPTAGCIGAGEAYVLGYLRSLDASQNPYIVIV